MTKGKQAAFAERRAKALNLNVRGRSLPEIARISREEDWAPRPYKSAQAVHADICVALKQLHEQRNEMAGIYLQRELEKLDAMEAEAWRVLEALHYVVNQGEVVYLYDGGPPETIKQGWARPKLDPEVQAALERKRDAMGRDPLIDNKPVLDALNVLLKIAERRSKLLGLDAPVKKQVDVTTSGGVDERIAALLAKLGGPGQGEAAAGVAED